MNRRKKALVLSGIASLLLLCGCGETNTVTIDGVEYIQRGDEYVKLDLSPVTFEPGTHIIHYTYHFGSQSIGGQTGWGTSNLQMPEVPEGYRFVETLSVDEGGHGYTNTLVHIFVNEKTVEVQGTYNPNTNTIEYKEPGKVVEELTLGN